MIAVRQTISLYVYRGCILATLLLAYGSLVSQTVNFNADVAPIIYRHCTSCHRAGGAGPMPFTNYEETLAYGAMIEYVTRTRYMPPWKATPGYGHFAPDLSLDDEQIEVIQQWAADGFQEGPAVANKDLHAEKLDRETDDTQWDLTLEMDTAFEQYDIYFDQFQVFRLSTGLTTDKWVELVEFVPGNRTIVRYASVSISSQAIARRLDKWDPRYGYTSFGGPGFMPDQDSWFTWTIGDELENTGHAARFLPAGADLLLYVHYGPTGVKKFDRSKLRLKFMEEGKALPARHSVSLINPTLLRNGVLELEAGEYKTIHAQTVLPQAIELTAIEPHGLLLTRSWEVFARLPGGNVVPLLKIENYDFHWRREYHLAEPIRLPAGTVLHGRAVYDNRPDSPFIPVSPPVKAKWGYRLYNEQFQVRFHFQLDEGDRIKFLPGVANQTDIRRKISFWNKTESSLTLVVENFNSSKDVIKMNLNELTAGLNEFECSLDGLAYGNYQLILMDREQEVVSSEYFVYWPPEMTKSLLDE